MYVSMPMHVGRCTKVFAYVQVFIKYVNRRMHVGGDVHVLICICKCMCMQVCICTRAGV